MSEQEKQKLIKDIENYIPSTETENHHKIQTLKFLNESNNNFCRSNLKGHITSSAWLIDKDKTKALLTHHRKLNKWFQPGGHADGNPDILQAAIKEAKEESGFKNVFPVINSIFDIDVHIIPETTTKGEPAHFHYDIRYLLWTSEDKFTVSKESINLKWIDIDEIENFVKFEAIHRMIIKWKKWI